MFILHTLFFVVLASIFIGVTSDVLGPLSDEFIDHINSKQSTWTAGRNFPVHTPFSYIENLLGVLEEDASVELPQVTHDDELIISLPENFDPREKWPNCPSLNEIRDQGSCGNCWAFAAVETMTDRYCIYSNGTQQFHFSAQDVTSCCTFEYGAFGCSGGFPSSAWRYWKEKGIVSGGNYDSNEGCKPYEFPPCGHHVDGKLPPCNESLETPACVNSCIPSYDVEYKKDKRYAKEIYSVSAFEDQLMAELFKNGPVNTKFTVYPDFLHYKSGVYQHLEGEEIGHHAVKMIGWGVENGVKYWLVANSWNEHWGDKGFFKILRGENHCDIEDIIYAGVPIII